MYILSQILVVFSDIFCITSMLSKKKRNVVLFLLFSTIFFALHYICLNGWTGAVIALLEIVFLISMYFLEVKNKTKYNKHLSIGTIVASVILSIITWDSWISALPMTAMVIYLTTMMFSNVIIVKSGTFIRFILNAIYMVLLKSYFGAILSIVLLIFTIIGIVNDNKIKQQHKKNES